MAIDFSKHYTLFADLIVAFHASYVMFVVFGQVFILLGWIFKWAFIRNPYFRVIHFLSILVVAAQAILKMPCPLTIWEYQLRELAGQNAQWEISFIGRLLRLLIFFDFPPWFFTILHVGFASVVLITLILVPPKFNKRQPKIQ
jgi:hypothetical protein